LQHVNPEQILQGYEGLVNRGHLMGKIIESYPEPANPFTKLVDRGQRLGDGEHRGFLSDRREDLPKFLSHDGVLRLPGD
jgi:hypothetical protein